MKWQAIPIHPTQFDVTKLKDSSVTDAFQFELVNKFHIASTVSDVKDKLEQFKDTAQEAAETMISFKQNIRRKKSISDYKW